MIRKLSNVLRTEVRQPHLQILSQFVSTISRITAEERGFSGASKLKNKCDGLQHATPPASLV